MYDYQFTESKVLELIKKPITIDIIIGFYYSSLRIYSSNIEYPIY